MRKWHRWLSVTFGVVLLWIAVTGLLSQIVPLAQGDPEQTAATATPPGFKCPETMMCRPKPAGANLISTLHHLHSGESFGPAGVAIGTLAGFAMVFFAFSGLWMYIQMWRNRAKRRLKPGWFWN